MTGEGFDSGYEVLEHTADVGLRIWAPTLQGVFAKACWGMVEILGARADKPSDMFFREDFDDHVANRLWWVLQAGRGAYMHFNACLVQIDQEASTVTITDVFDDEETLSIDEFTRRLRERTAPSGAEPRSVDVHAEAAEVEGLLVDWLNEVLYHLDESEACLYSVGDLLVSETSLRATLELSPCQEGWSGTELKAASYHQLSLARDDAGWRGTVFFDV